MGRPQRIHFSGALYHVINRGVNKGTIFLDDKDYNVFLKKLKEVQEEKPFYLYGYCIMPNHLHLLLEVINEPLSKIMQMLLTSYALYFNARYKRTGHVFQGRYKAVVCEKERYLLQLVQYIHLNPIRAKLVKNIDNYKWSSHQYYTGKIKNKNLSIEKLFKYMGGSVSEGFNIYKNIMNEKLNIKVKVDFTKIYKNDIFGTESFINEIKSKKIEMIDVAKSAREKTLPEILNDVIIEFKIPKAVILSSTQSRPVNQARKMFYFKSFTEYGYTLNEISKFINKDISIINRAVREIKKI